MKLKIIAAKLKEDAFKKVDAYLKNMVKKYVLKDSSELIVGNDRNIAVVYVMKQKPVISIQLLDGYLHAKIGGKKTAFNDPKVAINFIKKWEKKNLIPKSKQKANVKEELQKALDILESELPRGDGVIDEKDKSVELRDFDRGPRTDHGGGEDGDDWLDDYQLEELEEEYYNKHKSSIKSAENRIKKEVKLKFRNLQFDYGEKGHLTVYVNFS